MLRTDHAGNQGGCVHGVSFWENAPPKLHALVFDILPPATAMIDYAIGVQKLSANGQNFVGAQIAVIL